jgi:hypothetical protein
MSQSIKTQLELEEILKRHTGSNKVPYGLDEFFRQEPYGPVDEYIAYSRNKNTLLFKKIASEHIELISIYPKIKRSSFYEGIDELLLLKLQPFLGGNKWTIKTRYGCKIVIDVQTSTLTEQQIIEIMKLGFIRVDVYHSSGETCVIMQ